MGRHIDFDAAWREAVGPPPTITVFGKLIELPDEMPAVVILKREALMAADPDADQADADETDVWDLLALVVGREQVDEWVNDKRIGIGQSWALLSQIAKAIRTDDDDGSAEGEQPAPTTGPTAEPSATSSKGGTPSRPISSASTGSTSNAA